MFYMCLIDVQVSLKMI